MHISEVKMLACNGIFTQLTTRYAIGIPVILNGNATVHIQEVCEGAFLCKRAQIARNTRFKGCRIKVKSRTKLLYGMKEDVIEEMFENIANTLLP